MSNLIIPINIQQISKKAKNNITKHVEYSIFSNQIKEIIINDIEGEKNHFYFCYASLFTENENHLIDNINLAGYFYYKYLIATDVLVDNSNNSKNRFKHLILSNFYHEESIRLLSDIFSSHPEFWKYWGLRKTEYLNAYQTDKKNLTTLLETEFQALADSKSANGKVAIDSLLIIGAINKSEYEALLLSHKLFSCGFQLYDDVLDLKEDILNKQTNIALCELKKIMSAEIFLQELESSEKLHKLMHIKGVSSQLLKKAITYFEEAENTVELINCSLWKQAIKIKKQEVKAVLQNVEFYVESLKIKVRLSNKKKQQLGNQNTIFDNSISLAFDFITKEQENNGSWKDSPVNTWLSGYWTTGYVLNAIKDCDTELVSKINIEQSLNYLQEKENVAWPYVHGWLEDADSSNFSLLGLTANKVIVQNELIELLKFQQNDGGFATYKNPQILLNYLNDPKITNVLGWTQSHICVSAGTLLVLSKYPNQFLNEKEKLISYIVNSVSSDGLWYSYWWTSPIYTTSLIIEAANAIQNNELSNIVEKAVAISFSQQQQNGLFADEFNNKHIFYSALLLNAVCSNDKFVSKYKKQIQLLAKAILEEQNDDGSWDSSFALRIPSANCIDPKLITSWKKSDLGENIIIEDIHRIITTSSVVCALSSYEKIKSA